MQAPNLGALLESAYQDFHGRYTRDKDPISLVHPYRDPADQEVVAFLTALLSYGNVATILRSARTLLDTLGQRPSALLASQKPLPRLPGFRHRFTTGQDLETVLNWCRGALHQAGSLEAFFLQGAQAESLKPRLSSFVQRLVALPLPPALSKAAQARTRPLRHLLPDPARGSACKRLNMFLRWVVRPADGIDLGLWKHVSASQLVLPLDTHLVKTVRALGWVPGNQAGWAAAELATRRLAEFCPQDPLRYDFALCHLSMEGGRILHYKAGHHASLEPRPLHKKGPQGGVRRSSRVQARRNRPARKSP